MSRWIVFDLGGVLVRITLVVHEAAQLANVQLPPEWAFERFTDLPAFQDYQAGRLTCAGYLEALAGQLGGDHQAAEQLHDAIVIEPYPGALDLLDSLRSRGFRLGILSNTNAPHWEKIRPFGLFQRVDLALGSHEVALEKPDPAIYSEFARQSGGQSFLFFDDSLANVEGAREAGWQADWVSPEDPIRQLSELL